MSECAGLTIKSYEGRGFGIQPPIDLILRKARASARALTDCIVRVKYILHPMRTNLVLDDNLLATAERYTGLKEKSALIQEALRALIERESARRLAGLGGSEPGFKPAARRQTPA